MNRVLIIGCSGSGKTTLARALAERTGLPLVHLDQEYFTPGWTEMDREGWRAHIGQLAAGPQWIMDGNYGGTFDLRVPRADTIVFLDRSTGLCLYRAVRRTLQYYGRERPYAPEGCPERFDWEFTTFIMGYNRSRRPGILRMLAEQPTSTATYRLRSNRAVQAFLRTASSGQRG